MKMKTLILYQGEDRYFFPKIVKELRTNNEIKFMDYFKDSSDFFHRASRKANYPILKPLLGNWKDNTKNYDLFILFDTGFSTKIAKYIKKNNSSAIIVLYNWNKITPISEKFIKCDYVDHVFTFDKNDSQKFNINFCDNFYFMDDALANNEIEFDACFLGRNKGRETEVNNLEKSMRDLGLNPLFEVINSEKDFKTYDEYLALLSRTNSILDINQKFQNGLTLRVMESIFFKKKLITNNDEVMNYNFYNDNNIFVLSQRDISELKSFLQNEFISTVDTKEYDFYRWIEKIKKGIS